MNRALRTGPAITTDSFGWRRWSLACMALLSQLAVLASCTPEVVPVEPPVALPEAFSAQGEAPTPGKWWTAFGDAQLNSLIDQALQDNFSLRIAWDRLDQARAVAAQSGAPLLPSLDGNADASRTVRKASGVGRTYNTDYSLGLVASYEADLWGRVRSTHDAEQLNAYASDEDVNAAAVTVTAEIAQTWHKLIEQRGQLSLLDEQIKTNQTHVDVITLKFRRGQVFATDVLQQRELVESSRGDRVLVESGVKVLEHQLAVLSGRSPGSVVFDVPEELPSLPPLPATGLVADWLRRRPDVRAAELRVRAADRRVAAAIADQFPKLGLTINAETSAERVRDLFDNWLAGLAANLAAPLFDAGQRRAEVKRARAAVSEQLSSYGQVVLNSVREVEDALSQEASQARYVASLVKQLELAKRSTDQTLENYTKGTMDFTRYLTTLLSHQQLQRSHLQSRRDLVLFRIDLYRALAGGWELPRPPQAGAPTSK